jgi:hypothetical protein
MTLHLPKDARRVAGAKPWDELHKHVNELYWGDRECNGPPAVKPTAYRGVVVMGCVIVQKPGIAGDLVLATGGSWTFDDKEPEVARALAAQLREAADALDREAGS